MSGFATVLTNALAENQITLSHDAQNKLEQFLQLMVRWNKVFNLTAITDVRDMVYLHIIDSLLIAPYVQGITCLDVGSGAGLPGIPLAIMDPNRQWTLLDKNSKKTRFLTQVVAELALPNVKIATNACRDFHPGHAFDSILARAFTTMGLFIKEGEHLLAQDGIFLAMKGKYPKEELTALPPDFIVPQIQPIRIKGMNIERHVVCIARKK